MIDPLSIKRGKSRAVNAENLTGEKGKGGMASSHLGQSRKGSPCLRDIAPGEEVVLADIRGAGMISHIWMTVDQKTSDAECFVLRDLILKFFWDGEAMPSVEVPLGDFFCCGFGRECLVNSACIAVAPMRGLNSYFQMPFGRGAKIVLVNDHPETLPVFFYQIDYILYEEMPANTEYFHAQWRRQAVTEKGKDYVILDNVQGCGRYVGTYLALSTLERYWWGEGEVKFYLDGDREFPTICGTGMEDYFGGSWSFAGYPDGKMQELCYSMPYLGYPFYSRHDTNLTHPYHNDNCPPMRGFYRWHMCDPIFFEEDLKVTVQQIGVSHRGLFERQDDLSSVAYWYQREPHQRFPELPGREDRRPR